MKALKQAAILFLAIATLSLTGCSKDSEETQYSIPPIDYSITVRLVQAYSDSATICANIRDYVDQPNNLDNLCHITKAIVHFCPAENGDPTQPFGKESIILAEGSDLIGEYFAVLHNLKPNTKYNVKVTGHIYEHREEYIVYSDLCTFTTGE